MKIEVEIPEQYVERFKALAAKEMAQTNVKTLPELVWHWIEYQIACDDNLQDMAAHDEDIPF